MTTMNAAARLLISEKAPIIAIAGPPAAGKTHYAEELARLRPETIIVDPDVIGKTVVDTAMGRATGNRHDRDGDFYRQTIMPDHRTIVAASIRILHSAGVPVILSYPLIDFANRATRENRTLRDVASEEYGVPFDLTVWLDIPEELQRSRLLRRDEPRDKPKFTDWEGYRERLGDAADLGDGIADIVLKQ